MDDELKTGYRRWIDADGAGRDDEADAAFRSLFRDVAPDAPASPEFTTRTMQALSAEAVRTAVRARRTRRALAIASAAGLAAATYFGAAYVLSAMTTASVGLFDLVVGAVVRTAAAARAGTDLWSVLGTLGNAASAFVADPKVTFVLLVLQGLALGALVALQRLLGSDGESWK